MGNDNEKPTAQTDSAASADDAPGKQQDDSRKDFSGNVTRALVLAMSAVAFALFWWVGTWIGFPSERGYQASILQNFSAGSITTLICGAILLVIAALAGQLLGGHRWLYAGLFTACSGLGAWSCRGGASRYVVFLSAAQGDGRGIFLTLAVESAILCAMVGAIWYWVTSRALALHADPKKPANKVTISEQLQAIGLQTLITMLLVMILTPIDAKKEVLASLFVASFVATSMMENFHTAACIGPWYWAGPAAASFLGYVLCFIANAANAPSVNGDLYGLFAPLGRPLPLDWASAAMLGAMLGYYATRADDFPVVHDRHFAGVRKLLNAQVGKPDSRSSVAG